MLEAAQNNAAKSPLQKMKREEQRKVDVLFAGKDGKPLEFVGPSGKYEPGKLADAERDKLPEHSVKLAILYVEQLLNWMPLDDRLYWQLGELVSADGYPAEALEIFDILANKKNFTLGKKEMPYEEFKAHHEITRAYVKEMNEKQNKSQTNVTPTNTTPPPQPPAEENWEERWRFFGVGVGCGGVLALFAFWQLRRFLGQRRRSAFPAGGPPQRSTGIQKLH
jgi:hypothetical protein